MCCLIFIFMLYVMMMGKWSELSAVVVFHVILLAILFVAVVMSGDVGCWSECGSLVGVFVLSIICDVFCIMSVTSVPL